MALYHVLTGVLFELFKGCKEIKKYGVDVEKLKGKSIVRRKAGSMILLTDLYIAGVSHTQISTLHGTDDSPIQRQRQLLFGTGLSGANRLFIQNCLQHALASFLLRECILMCNLITRDDPAAVKTPDSIIGSQSGSSVNNLYNFGWAAFSVDSRIGRAKGRRKPQNADIQLQLINAITCNKQYLIEHGIQLPTFVMQEDLGGKTYLKPNFKDFQHHCLNLLNERLREVTLYIGMKPIQDQLFDFLSNDDGVKRLFLKAIKSVAPHDSAFSQPEHRVVVKDVLESIILKVCNHGIGRVVTKMEDDDLRERRRSDFRKELKHKDAGAGETNNRRRKRGKKKKATTTESTAIIQTHQHII